MMDSKKRMHVSDLILRVMKMGNRQQKNLVHPSIHPSSALYPLFSPFTSYNVTPNFPLNLRLLSLSLSLQII
jgi:hypothetical protein